MDFCHPQDQPARLIRWIAPPSVVNDAAKSAWLQIAPPRVIAFNRLELAKSRLPRGLDGLRLLHLSDVHLRRNWPAALDALLAHIRADPPDLVLFTGDFVDNKFNYRTGLPNVRRFVKGLTARYGLFAIHGNHDSYKIGQELIDLPIVLLDGRRMTIELPGGAVELLGLPGRLRKELTAAVLRQYPAPQPRTLRIILSHFPDHLLRTQSLRPDLFLSGHTHGGQICLPNGYPPLSHDSLPRRLCAGAHRIGQTWLVVSRGIGFTGLPIRAWCPPEATEIILRRSGDGEAASSTFATPEGSR